MSGRRGPTLTLLTWRNFPDPISYQEPKNLTGAPAVLGHGPTYEAGARRLGRGPTNTVPTGRYLRPPVSVAYRTQVRLSKVIALEHKNSAPDLCQRIGKAVAVVQAGRTPALAIPSIPPSPLFPVTSTLMNPASRRRRCASRSKMLGDNAFKVLRSWSFQYGSFTSLTSSSIGYAATSPFRPYGF